VINNPWPMVALGTIFLALLAVVVMYWISRRTKERQNGDVKMDKLIKTLDNWKVIGGVVLWVIYLIYYPESGMKVPPEWMLPVIYGIIGVGGADKVRKITEALGTKKK